MCAVRCDSDFTREKEGGYSSEKTVQDEFGFGTFSTNSAYGFQRILIYRAIVRSSSGGAAGWLRSSDAPHCSWQSTGGLSHALRHFAAWRDLHPHTKVRDTDSWLCEFAWQDRSDRKCVSDVRIMYDIIKDMTLLTRLPYWMKWRARKRLTW